jgi:hypothetical protein
MYTQHMRVDTYLSCLTIKAEICVKCQIRSIFIQILTEQNCVLTREVRRRMKNRKKRIKSLILNIARDIKLVLILIFMFHEIERQAKT